MKSANSSGLQLVSIADISWGIYFAVAGPDDAIIRAKANRVYDDTCSAVGVEEAFEAKRLTASRTILYWLILDNETRIASATWSNTATQAGAVYPGGLGTGASGNPFEIFPSA